VGRPGGYARCSTTASAARLAFDELLLSHLHGKTQCAPHTSSRRICRHSQKSVFTVRHIKPLTRSESRCRRRGTPCRRDADCGSQWRFPRLRACPTKQVQVGQYMSVSQANPKIYWTRPTDLFCHNLSNCDYCAHRTAAPTLGERVGRSGASSTCVWHEPRPKRRRDGSDMRDGPGGHPIRI